MMPLVREDSSAQYYFVSLHNVKFLKREKRRKCGGAGKIRTGFRGGKRVEKVVKQVKKAGKKMF
ncbi:MAG: hypothetical protein Q4B85_11065 [Lachnospiraceae bacterium]|nr:hypothetical protein [Lachnospiraceae bacterium]